MSTRPAGRWPVSRPVGLLILAAAGALALAGAVPAVRGGLFLLAGAAVVGLFAARGLRH